MRGTFAAINNKTLFMAALNNDRSLPVEYIADSINIKA